MPNMSAPSAHENADEPTPNQFLRTMAEWTPDCWMYHRKKAWLKLWKIGSKANLGGSENTHPSLKTHNKKRKGVGPHPPNIGPLLTRLIWFIFWRDCTCTAASPCSAMTLFGYIFVIEGCVSWVLKLGEKRKLWVCSYSRVDPKMSDSPRFGWSASR